MASFKGLLTFLLGDLVDKYSQIFIATKESLPKADMKISFRTYMSIVLFVTAVSYVVSLVALIFILGMFNVSVFLKIIYLIFVPVLVAVVSFVALSFYPLQRAMSRRKNIEYNLPFVLTNMGAIAESGVPPYIIFKLIGEFEEYGEISKEMKKITRSIDTFGVDPLTAVKKVAERSPSEEFKQALLGFVTTTESGGDIKVFLKSVGQQAMFEWKMKREKYLQQLSTYAEFYTGILIAAPLFVIALFAVMSVIQPTIGGFGIIDITKISVYGIVPILNVAFLLFLKGVEVEM
jgi:flagellar protein FlaJ